MQPAPNELRFCGTGDSDEFFDVWLLLGDRLIGISTQERAKRDALRDRLERGESLERLRAEAAEHIFSLEEVRADQIKQLEWCEGSNVFRVEYETTPGGGLSDVGGFLDAAAVPRLLDGLHHLTGRTPDIRKSVVTALSLIVVIAPSISLFVAFLAWGSMGLGWIGALGVALVSFLALSALLWFSNREPSVCHIAKFREG